MKKFFAAFLVFTLSVSVYAQEEIRKKKPGWADLGVRVEDVEGKITVKEAGEGEIKVGDVIVAFDGTPVKSSEELMSKLWAMDLDKTVKVKLADREVEVKLKTILGQKNAGTNNWEHHPPAIRAVPIDPTSDVGKGTLKTVYAFDLTMSFEWDLTEQEMTDAKSMIEQAARILFDATEGQMYVRRVEIYTKKEAWDRVNYWVQKQRLGGGMGIEHVTPGGQCRLVFSRLDRTAAIILAHEAGHMQFGSGDEYPYKNTDKQEDCPCLMGRGCFNGQYELCTKKTHAYAEKESCWDNLKRWYPNIVKVDEPKSGPELTRLPNVVFKKEAEAPAESLDAKLDRMLRSWQDDLRRSVRDAVEKELKKK